MEKDTEWLSSLEAAKFLHVKEATLRKWRFYRRHLDFIKDKGKVRYSKDTLIKFINDSVRLVRAKNSYKR